MANSSAKSAHVAVAVSNRLVGFPPESVRCSAMVGACAYHHDIVVNSHCLAEVISG